MVKKTQAALTTHFKRLWVTTRPAMPGHGIADTSLFAAGQEYEVLATELKVWDDGSTTLCFLLANEEGGLQEIAAEACKFARKQEVA